MEFEEIKKNIEYGDYNTLKLVLETKTVQAARQRFLRGDKKAIEAMQFIQNNRNELPELFREQSNPKKQASND